MIQLSRAFGLVLLLALAANTALTQSADWTEVIWREPQVRYLLADMTGSGQTDLYRKYATEERDPDSREAIRLWDAGVRVINMTDFERKWVTNQFGKDGRVFRVVQRGTDRTTLGHRDIESPSVYLRLDMDELRQVALAVPATPPGPLAKLVGVNALPQIRPARACHHLPTRFQSRLAPSLQTHVDLKRALGRHYVAEAAVLRHWDNFIRRRYPRARQVRAEMFSGWTKTLVTLTSTVSRSAHRIVRNFLLFHARSHPSTFIPDRLTFPKNAPSVTPRLVSAVEMGRALAAVGQLPPSFGNPLRAETFHLGLLLLFCCGLRRRELLRLTLADLQAEQTVLHIRCSEMFAPPSSG